MPTPSAKDVSPVSFQDAFIRLCVSQTQKGFADEFVLKRFSERPSLGA
jgi:hypothetical protein